MSLAKFAEIFKLSISKDIFPYEYFHDVEELRQTVSWPDYIHFGSSLPSAEKDFVGELDEILNLPIIYGFDCLGDLIKFLKIDFELTVSEYQFLNVSSLSENRSKELKRLLFLSPKIYFEKKFEFEGKIESGRFSNFLDYLIYYNDKDINSI